MTTLTIYWIIQNCLYDSRFVDSTDAGNNNPKNEGIAVLEELLKIDGIREDGQEKNI